MLSEVESPQIGEPFLGDHDLAEEALPLRCDGGGVPDNCEGEDRLTLLPCQSLELLGYRAAFLKVHCKLEGFVRVRHFPAHLASSVEWAITSLMGLSIEVPLAKAFAAHSMTTVANIDGEGCLKASVSADRSDDYLGDCVMRNPVETHRSVVILENLEVELEGDHARSTLDVEVEVGGELPIVLGRLLRDEREMWDTGKHRHFGV